MLQGPKRRPQEFGFGAGDTHLVFNSQARDCKVFNHLGVLRVTLPALMNGQHWNWEEFQGDTPPGLYRCGQVWDDYSIYGDSPPNNRTTRAFGWVTIDMIDLEGNEDNSGRAGIAIHGGGSGLGFPGAWAPRQRLIPTWGCIRMHNEDIYRVLLPLLNQGKVYCSVWQDLE